MIGDCMKYEIEDMKKRSDVIRRDIKNNHMAMVLMLALFIISFMFLFFPALTPTPPAVFETITVFSMLSLFALAEEDNILKSRLLLIDIYIKTFFDKDYKPADILVKK